MGRLRAQSYESEGEIIFLRTGRSWVNIPLYGFGSGSRKLRIRKVTYRITIGQSPVEAFEDKNTNAFASSVA